MTRFVDGEEPGLDFISCSADYAHSAHFQGSGLKSCTVDFNPKLRRKVARTHLYQLSIVFSLYNSSTDTEGLRKLRGMVVFLEETTQFYSGDYADYAAHLAYTT